MNLLVRSLYKIQSPQWFRDRSNEGDLFDLYSQMHEISLKSFQKHLKGDWEFVFYTKTVENIQEVFRDHFFEIYNLWREGHNILYCGPDNMMMLPTEVFGVYDDFRMFNYTDPKSFNQPNHYNIQHTHFFNADVRYYPQTMAQSTWDLGLALAERWDYNCWNTEQIILNQMLWHQEGRTIENTLMPTMAYQGHELYLQDYIERVHHSNKWNNCKLENSHIVHLHGSRNAPAKLQLMQQMSKNI